MQRKRLTLKDLAHQLGVHYSTVSRVMNPATRHMVAVDVAARILQAADASGFRPNHIAAGLRTGRSRLVGVVLPDIANPIFPAILWGLEQVLAEQGYVPIVVNVGADTQRQRFIIDQMVGRQVDGLVLATAERDDPILDHCVKQGIPVVIVNRGEDIGRVSCVVSDNRLGMRLTVDHLTGLGHRKIGQISGPSSLSTGYLRREGFIDAVKANGLKKSEWVSIDSAAYTREAGQVACAELLERLPGLTAIAASNDLVALGCYDVLREKGLRCPEDISVVGHNDMPFVDALYPALTTIRIPLRDMGAHAGRLILQRIAEPASDGVSIVLRPELIVRGSTAAPTASKSSAKVSAAKVLPAKNLPAKVARTKA